ncbi:MAG: flagellar hook-associated family protein [Rhizobiaceae bacterium]|nr:flagellar hook-associated family protein [Rhizobiaceae bacterium]
MKTSFVSSPSVSQAMRYSLLKAQAELTKAQKEVSTGKVADIGLALGSRTTQVVSLNRDLDRLNGIVDSNGLISSRLKATQSALGQLGDAAQTFFSTLTANANGDAGSGVVLTESKATLGAFTSVLNTALNGEYLFAGINTDVRPVNDYNAAGSPAKAAFDAAFQSHFGFTQNDPAAANITAADMTTFLDTVLEPQFMGPGWQGTWSNATDDTIVSRVTLNETLNTSVSANEQGLRKLAMAASMVQELFSSNVGQAALTAVVDKAIKLTGDAISDVSNLQAKTGIIENRVSNASARLNTQIDLYEKLQIELEGVDPYEASTRVSTLLSQIETTYALTARLQQLSLAKYLT